MAMKIKGIRETPSGKFQARIGYKGKSFYLGQYATAEEAQEVYNAFILKFQTNKGKYFPHTNRSHSSGYKYVESDRTGRYLARVNRNRERISLGTFDSPVEAAIAVNTYLDRIGDKGLRNDLLLEDLIDLKRRKKEQAKILKKQFEDKDMKRLNVKNYKYGPEWKIQKAIKKYLEARDWYVRILHGNTFQAGLTDLVAFHKKYGVRFIEVKNPKKYSFTPAQLQEFPKIISHGTPIYILTGANEENYKRLFKKSNLWVYMIGFNT